MEKSNASLVIDSCSNCWFEDDFLFLYFSRRYNEVCEADYDFVTGDKGNGQAYLHFTQIVWKESTELGIGFAKGTKGSMTCYYAVGRYRKRGNFGFKEDYQKNVVKGKISILRMVLLVGYLFHRNQSNFNFFSY